MDSALHKGNLGLLIQKGTVRSYDVGCRRTETSMCWQVQRLHDENEEGIVQDEIVDHGAVCPGFCDFANHDLSRVLTLYVAPNSLFEATSW